MKIGTFAALLGGAFLMSACSQFAVAPTYEPAHPYQPPAAITFNIKEYSVLFKPGSARLSKDAKAVIAEAAAAYHQGKLVGVEGHTDTVGKAHPNNRLSKRRAYAVAWALRKHGVKSRDMVINGVGTTDLAVPTGPNVSELQNRRVLITVPF